MAFSRRTSRSQQRPPLEIELHKPGSRSQSPANRPDSYAQPRPGYLSPQFGSRSDTPTGSRSPTPGGTRRNSIAESVRSRQSLINESIKYEVMVGYLSQQQTAATWISDTDGDIEGVILRKHRGYYLSHPEHLIDAPIGQACTSLNLRVRFDSIPAF
jgi:hypothetical protein